MARARRPRSSLAICCELQPCIYLRSPDEASCDPFHARSPGTDGSPIRCLNDT
jgi:hypothetical protein